MACSPERRLGAIHMGGGQTRFLVWAPRASRVDLCLAASPCAFLPMTAAPHGYFETVAGDVWPGARYWYRLDGDRQRPDPASRFQPEGVHGPSEVTDPEFAWQAADWQGLAPERYIFYELHAGTFTPEGTLEAASGSLDRLVELGVTAVELMPLAQFPGSRNWGYDGVYPFAVQNSYGGPAGLKRLVDACHSRGLAVALDVVYNHLGPEGNYLNDFAPYFTDRYRTPWGRALNFDGPSSDEVRRFFLENALHWVTEFRIDALRLDSVDTILDWSSVPFVRELCQAVHARAAQLGRQVLVVAESAANDVRTVTPAARHGHGFDAQWSDDFHHALHTVLTGERGGYYADYGEFAQLCKAFHDGYVYTGEYSRFRRRRHGSPADGAPGRAFVVCAQNHDQVGNRMRGERLSALVSFEQLKVAAGAVLLAPYLPLLFMGEEYGETAPFQYFVSHSDPALVEAVRCGRREEFASFAWQGACPDPQDERTFQASRLRGMEHPRQRALFEFHKELLRLRRTAAALAAPDRHGTDVAGDIERRVVRLHRRRGASHALAVFNFGGSPARFSYPAPAGVWRRALDSSAAEWTGPGGGPPATLCRGGAAELPGWSLAVYLDAA